MSDIARIVNEMTSDFKEELLARYFYYIDLIYDVSFDSTTEDERNFCRFVSRRYIKEHKANELITVLINRADKDYLRALDSIMWSEEDSWKQKDAEEEKDSE